MIYKDFIKYFRTQIEKPKNTTEFIKRYQQINSGKNTYLHEAIIQGKKIYKCEGEPNQKWHLLYAWYPAMENVLSEQRVTSWCKLQCPELLLWIAEVSGQEQKVQDVVSRILDDKKYEANDAEARREMVQLIKSTIDWNDIIEYIEGKIKH